MENQINNKLAVIRRVMVDRGMAALVITSSDPHQSEYLADHWKTRQWITGFTGSAGTAVVTLDQALLWTDFRYWIQAQNQILGSEFKLMKQGEPQVKDVDLWLVENLAPKSRVAMDGQVASVSLVRKFRKKLETKKIALVTEFDLIKDLWTDRPPIPHTRAWDFSVDFAGKSRQAKLETIRKAMAESGAEQVLMTALDEIAWTFNLRGDDIPSNPVNMAFALVGRDRARLFMAASKVEKDLADLLAEQGILVSADQDITNALGQIPKDQTIWLDPEKTSFALFSAVSRDCRIIEKPLPSEGLKAVKNAREIAHIRETAVKDGAAVVNFLYWLAHRDKKTTEVSAAERLLAFRQQQPDFTGVSFTSIMAFGAHSAICHYSADGDSDVEIDDQGMFLTDSGGNYLTGTTDITRTLHLGQASAREIRDYTLVLKGHIAVATALFPAGTKGFQIDTLARQHLWKQGMNFGHGTGHGVGFFLSVHEGPARISPHPVDVALEPGMLLTNEPGVYREGKYGIRLENMILVQEARKTEFGKFLRFENLTLCHFEKKLMDKTLLTREEVQWINQYHERVYEKLKPCLAPEVGQWLRRKTREL